LEKRLFAVVSPFFFDEKSSFFLLGNWSSRALFFPPADSCWLPLRSWPSSFSQTVHAPFLPFTNEFFTDARSQVFFAPCRPSRVGAAPFLYGCFLLSFSSSLFQLVTLARRPEKSLFFLFCEGTSRRRSFFLSVPPPFCLHRCIAPSPQNLPRCRRDLRLANATHQPFFPST